MSRRAWQWVFLTAAAFNLVVAAAFAFFPTATLALMGAADPVVADPLWYALLWWLVAVFGIGYYMVSRDPERHRGIAFMGLIGKAGVWVVTMGMWGIAQEVPPLFIVLACGDLAYSLLFLLFLRDPRIASARTTFAN